MTHRKGIVASCYQMGEDPMKYIAYGSNMSAEHMALRCPGAKLLGVGHINNARLEFYTHATVIKTEDYRYRVPVAVWEISESDERVLDEYEGVPHYYTKETWSVEMSDRSQIRGMIYIMKLFRKQPPSSIYYRGIVKAYKMLGIFSEIEAVLKPALERSMCRSAK